MCGNFFKNCTALASPDMVCCGIVAADCVWAAQHSTVAARACTAWTAATVCTCTACACGFHACAVMLELL